MLLHEVRVVTCPTVSPSSFPWSRNEFEFEFDEAFDAAWKKAEYAADLLHPSLPPDHQQARDKCDSPRPRG